MKEQKAEVQLEVVKRVAQSNWSVEDLRAGDDVLTDLYIKGQDQEEKDKKEFEEWKADRLNGAASFRKLGKYL